MNFFHWAPVSLLKPFELGIPRSFSEEFCSHKVLELELSLDANTFHLSDGKITLK